MARFALSYTEVNQKPAVAACLDACLKDALPGTVSAGGTTAETWKNLQTFAALNGIKKLPNELNPDAWNKLTKQAKADSLHLAKASDLPDWMRKISAYNAAKRTDFPPMIVEDFIDAYAETFPEYLPGDNSWRANLQTFIGYIKDDAEMKDIRWISYLLASVMHECRRLADKWKAFWLPIEETRGGINQNKPYWDEEIVRDRAGKALDANNQVIANEKTEAGKLVKRAYFGRGFIQITWQENYLKMDVLMNLNGKLHLNPGLAIQDAPLSYKITSYGMRNGCFLDDAKEPVKKPIVCDGAKLADYFTATTTDYVGARRIVNADGKTNGKKVARYAEKFEAIIKATSAVIVAPEPKP